MSILPAKPAKDNLGLMGSLVNTMRLPYVWPVKVGYLYMSGLSGEAVQSRIFCCFWMHDTVASK